MTDPAAEPPWPGEELALRVTGTTEKKVFFESGQQSVRDLNRALGVLDRSLESYPSILEFGCGCGRIILWLGHLAGAASLHGVDIDERAIRWAQDNMPYATFKVNSALPPLDYPDDSFDLVYNHSVFTHLDEEYQDRWLEELRRVTKPGGTILLTVHGDEAVRYVSEMMANAGGDGDSLPQRPAAVGHRVRQPGLQRRRTVPRLLPLDLPRPLVHLRPVGGAPADQGLPAGRLSGTAGHRAHGEHFRRAGAGGGRRAARPGGREPSPPRRRRRWATRRRWPPPPRCCEQRPDVESPTNLGGRGDAQPPGPAPGAPPLRRAPAPAPRRVAGVDPGGAPHGRDPRPRGGDRRRPEPA